MKKIWTTLWIIITFSLLVSCGQVFDRGQLNNVGLLLDGTIHDETWGKGAYLGALNIKDEHNVSVLTHENVTTQRETEEHVKDLDRQGVNLIFGHGAQFGQYFDQLNEYYPDIHFVYFNGNTFDHNITSIQFDGFEMGYFAGKLSAKMTETGHIGVISAYQNQPEVQGFFEGVRSVDSDVQLQLKSVFDWYDQQRAMLLFDELMENDIDVVYPAGDGFNVPIINAAQEQDIYAIGYINDQYDVAPDTVITSTIQDLEELYLHIADEYDNEDLPSGIIHFGFDNKYVHLGEFGDEVSEDIQEEMEQSIANYIDTGSLD
ncbi:BMP family ABC transporter substrate-binding protein [Aquisalibacillus elongatus]|uniref:Nucleoside-binding protein n=1 Tax=Aquisalibacillus elongatus TaxID=485577 RepID=A0A3N5BQP5_9BACI|nr:BMP family ABC transporter substrate-binding protein [Aquisalibacillus elongatus]RPF52098.1 nucleoside-binding protein [Aquisalibacillus elongatus]